MTFGSYGFNEDEAEDHFFSHSDIGGSGFVEIMQFDPFAELTSGLFEFTAINGSGESVTVSNGSFYMLDLDTFSACLSFEF